MQISRCVASLLRHAVAYMCGDRDEDHMAAVMCNAMFIMHYEEMIGRGVLPKELGDMPDYGNDRMTNVQCPMSHAENTRDEKLRAVAR